MKNIKLFAVAIVLVIMSIGFSLSFAQTTAPTTEEKTVLQATFDPADTILTSARDTLWNYSPLEYDRIIAMNPEFKLVKVVYGPGDIRVNLPVGIMIKGVKRAPANLTAPSPTPTPSPSPSPSQTPPPPPPAGSGMGAWLSGLISNIPWLLIGMIIVIVVLMAALAYTVFVIWFNRNRRGAANAGPRFEQNGINDRTAAEAFARQYRNVNTDGPTFTVENLRRRRASGAITVAYNNGTSETRVLENDVVYLADLHYSDGTVRRDEMLLSACGNPLRRGGNVLSYAPGLGFRFVDDRPVFVAPVMEEQSTAAANLQPTTQTGVVFNGGTAVITTNGKTVEVAADEQTSFSKVESTEEAPSTAVQIRKNGVRLVIRDGILAEVQSETVSAE